MSIPDRFLDATTLNYTIEHGVHGRDTRAAKVGERTLGHFILPPFQRASVWVDSQKVRFIESIWLNLPIACYVVNVDDRDGLGYPCDNWLLDGQQRWTAIVEYVNDHLTVFGLKWLDLTEVQRRRFLNHPFPAIQTRNLTENRCREVYERLAYGGTEHTTTEAGG